jgi:hypothetical protein
MIFFRGRGSQTFAWVALNHDSPDPCLLSS